MKKVVAIVGPTASGKTALSVELAKKFNGEIISADSMQVYKNMPIATAVAAKDEQDGVPHHLIEFLDADQEFSVADFVKLAKEKINDIISRGKTPFVVGGTGLFVDSLLNNVEFVDSGKNIELREKLLQKANDFGNDYLYNELVKIDFAAAEKIHPNNIGRVVRALELYYTTGVKISEQFENSRINPSEISSLIIGINYKERQNLYNRINKRVDIMLEQGILHEAEENANKGNYATSRQAIGHKELMPYINGKMSLDEACDNLKKQTRRYAKRQLTWFRRNENINWLYADDLSNAELISQGEKLINDFLKG